MSASFRLLAFRSLTLVLCSFQRSAARASTTVRLDAHWLDTDGNRIEAHGGGMLQSPTNGRWYWYGESRKDQNLLDHGITCYSAETLAGPWTYEGQAFKQDRILQADHAGPFVVERPKVLYNSHTKKFVMWFHLDDSFYSYRHVGVAQSDSPAGPFEFVHGMRPDGLPSLDMSLFQDPVDGQAYLIRSVDNEYAGISRLTADYLDCVRMISTLPRLEGMALFRHRNGTYYLIASHLTGWDPNPLMLFRAAGKTLDYPQWVEMGNPTNHPTSFNSQPTYVVQVAPFWGAPYFVYMADNWVHCSRGAASQAEALLDACYVWLPIELHGDVARIDWRDTWDMERPFASAQLRFA